MAVGKSGAAADRDRFVVLDAIAAPEQVLATALRALGRGP